MAYISVDVPSENSPLQVGTHVELVILGNFSICNKIYFLLSNLTAFISENVTFV